MAGIEEYLDKIKHAVYGREVRNAIHDGIHQCYEDGKAGAVDLIAREQIAELVAPSGEAPSAAEVTDARIGADGLVYASLGDANRSQFDNVSNEFIKLVDSGYFYHDVTNHINWGIGQIDTNTLVIGTQKYATYTSDILSFDHPVVFTSDDFDTYAISMVVYDTKGTSKVQALWFRSAPFIIPSGFRFRLQMRRKSLTNIVKNDDIYRYCHVYEVFSTDDYVWETGTLYESSLIVVDETQTKKVMIDTVYVPENSIISIDDYDTYTYSIQMFDSGEPYSQGTPRWSLSQDVTLNAGQWFRASMLRKDGAPITLDEVKKHFSVKADGITVDTIRRQLDGINTDISTVRDRLIALEESNSIPSYYAEHMETKVATINELRDSLENGTQFAFITDVHHNAYRQAYHAKALMNYLCDNTLIKEVFNGGDVANGKYGAAHLKKVQYVKDLRSGFDYCNADSYVKSLYVVGNHDIGKDWGGGEEAGAIISPAELYDLCSLKKYEGDIVQDKGNKFNYTYTDDTNHFYYVVASMVRRDDVTGQGYTDTYRWFVNALKNCPDGYTIVVMNHEVLSLRSPSEGVTNEAVRYMCDAIDAYNSRSASPIYAGDSSTVIDYSNCTGIVACFIGGHTHYDWNTTTTDGVPIIITTTDNYGAESVDYGIPNRRTEAAGTIAEQAFDVFTIDADNKTIYATRIGAGSDRQFTY